jgi:hypothetical protein
VAMTAFRVLVVAFAVVGAGAHAAAVQPPAPAAPQSRGSVQPPDPNAVTPAQIQRWFEAFTVLQAQEALGLNDAQYFRFVARLKTLQDAERRHQQTRAQILNELRKLTNPQTGTNDEMQISARMKELRDENERAAAELRKAYEGIDEVLDVRQQARFRIFEERMEQQKLELLMRARQNARNGGRGR